MIALDTNLIVRVMTRDDLAQARRAAKLMRDNSLWLSKTVLLETEWVLRYAYGYASKTLNSALTKLVALENLQVEDAPAVEAALSWNAAGLDFADALHFASIGPADSFATFDRGLAQSAAKCDAAPAIQYLGEKAAAIP